MGRYGMGFSSRSSSEGFFNRLYYYMVKLAKMEGED
jgi:hypothetical protein